MKQREKGNFVEIVEILVNGAGVKGRSSAAPQQLPPAH